MAPTSGVASRPEADEPILGRPGERGRATTVYDAVAGRATLNDRLRDSRDGRTTRQSSKIAGHHSAKDARLPPEDVLFRRKNAPVRYAEKDFYFANQDLPASTRLPDSDLLKSIHGYASRFYEALAQRHPSECIVGSRTVDERSLDETALLAFGILLEEAGREALGKKGDLAFTEGLKDTDEEMMGKETDTKTDNTSGMPRESTAGLQDDDAERRRKRRRVERGEESDMSTRNASPA